MNLTEAHRRALVATLRHVRELDKIEHELGSELTTDEENRILATFAKGAGIEIVCLEGRARI